MPTICQDAEATARAAAERIAQVIHDAVEERGVAHVALPGGTTPRRTYEILAPLGLDWPRVVLWLGDERIVPIGDPDRNATLVREALVERVAGDPPALREVRSGTLPDDAAEAYEAAIRAEVPVGGTGIPELDLAILGLGEDGHTASLFPGRSEVDELDRLVVPVFDAPKPPPNRVTMTLPLLGAARSLLMIATGAAKAPALAELLATSAPGPLPPSRLPRSRLEFFVDDEAAPRG